VHSKRIVKLWLMLPALALLLAGCGGFSASPSVSPASFFLPGLIKVTPPQQDAPMFADRSEPVETPVQTP